MNRRGERRGIKIAFKSRAMTGKENGAKLPRGNSVFEQYSYLPLKTMRLAASLIYSNKG